MSEGLGIAEKYLGAALAKISECDAVKMMMRLVYALAVTLMVQVLLLAYMAYKLT
jgi:hypothetical protein